LTDWGDSFLLPQLEAWSGRLGVPLPFSRAAGRGMGGRGGKSFFTYSRTVYQGGIRYLFGRWHLDAKNSFMLHETGTAGLFEIARIAKIPVQRAARCTIGTSLSSMQMDWAWRQGVLIPMDKAEAEDFRTAEGLISADKGGLCYEPEVGWHENVAEFDFTSMYPTLMVRRNISPETVNCSCCSGAPVPEIGHRLCRKRQGLVPAVLAPILEKRARYKSLAKAGGPLRQIAKDRAAAHKWCLVTCFGYLGFKNSRFGKIEVHECVTAWGRETLLLAKEAVERRGFKILHALVDSLWVSLKPGTDVEVLRRAVERESGCPLGLEGVYKWIRFCPSKVDEHSGVPGRYFGAFVDGTLKIRGLACRRRDTPELLKRLQASLLARLAQAPDVASCRMAGPELQELIEECRLRLKESRVCAEDLAIAFHLSKKPQDYIADTVSSIAAKQLAAEGVVLHPGETVRYVITSAHDRVKDWRSRALTLMEGALEYDAARYLELLERAAWEILDGLAPRPGRKPPTNRRDGWLPF
jgi:DNA polymerase elongation subunit (family B)